MAGWRLRARLGRLAGLGLLAGLLGVSVAAACPLCLGAFRPTASQQLVDLPNAVLARRSGDGVYSVLDLIKGKAPAGGDIPANAIQLDLVMPHDAVLLLFRDESWSEWVAAGAVAVEDAGWLREIARGKRAQDMTDEDWKARVALVLPHLQPGEPLATKIAYGELATAPYAALLAEKPRLDPAAIRRWLADPELSVRRPVYLLLLGVAGDEKDAQNIEQRLDAEWLTGDATDLGPALAADLQLRGPSRLAWVDARYMDDRARSTKELEAALLALSVLGKADGEIPRERIVESYLKFIRAHRDLAGLVAWDLAAWNVWDAAPLYREIMKSNIRQHFASQVAIAEYLARSPKESAEAAAVTSK